MKVELGQFAGNSDFMRKCDVMISISTSTLKIRDLRLSISGFYDLNIRSPSIFPSASPRPQVQSLQEHSCLSYDVARSSAVEGCVVVMLHAADMQESAKESCGFAAKKIFWMSFAREQSH